jgi:hypothetical protein
MVTEYLFFEISASAWARGALDPAMSNVHACAVALSERAIFMR